MDMQTLGINLRQARKQRHLTQTELADMAGMSRATVSGIENGTISEIGIRKIMMLCSVLGLELNVQAPSLRRPTLHTLVDEASQRKTGGRP